jgi:hypothetical protein
MPWQYGVALLVNASDVQFCRIVTLMEPPFARTKASKLGPDSQTTEQGTSAATPLHVEATTGTGYGRPTTDADSTRPLLAFTRSSTVPQSPYGLVVLSHHGYVLDSSSVQLEATSVEPGYSTPMWKSTAEVVVTEKESALPTSAGGCCAAMTPASAASTGKRSACSLPLLQQRGACGGDIRRRCLAA